MRQNGNGALTLEEARTWIEETGLCLFLPKKQSSQSLAPSFVEAVAGERNATPTPKQIATAEELLVRLELDNVAVRLNLTGQPGEQPDYIVAAWVLPYVYALRGDRDWRRTPQLTGSRQVSPLAIQAYKRLEQGEATISELRQALGQGASSDTAVLRAITELWQQLRIIPVIAAPGKAAKWQLLRVRFQKAIAEGASTSQVTAISVLASIFLQAVIAASMEEVEIFLAALTARSKIREVLRGLVATRQVHTLSMGQAPHFYVAGTLPEFSPSPAIYASATLTGYSSGYGSGFSSRYEANYSYGGGFLGREEELVESDGEPVATSAQKDESAHTNGHGALNGNAPDGNRNGNGHKAPAAGSKNGSGNGLGNGAGTGVARAHFHSRERSNGNRGAKSSGASRGVKPSKAHASANGHVSRPARSGASRPAVAGKPASAAVRKSGLSRTSTHGATTRSAAARGSRKPAMAGSGNSFRSKQGAGQGTKKRG
jgi:hypothetical protein